MNYIEERIRKEGCVKSGDVLKVDAFLNHQIDVALLDQIGREFKGRFADCPITKVLTIESSGIAVACAVFLTVNTETDISVREMNVCEAGC